MTSSFDADALWDLYDDSDATIRGHVVPEDNGNDGNDDIAKNNNSYYYEISICTVY